MTQIEERDEGELAARNGDPVWRLIRVPSAWLKCPARLKETNDGRE